MVRIGREIRRVRRQMPPEPKPQREAPKEPAREAPAKEPARRKEPVPA